MKKNFAVSEKKAPSKNAALRLSKPTYGSGSTRSALKPGTRRSRDLDIASLLKVAQLRAEKCELLEARESFEQAYELARSKKDLRLTMEALAGLLRLAGEAMDTSAVSRIGRDLDQMMKKYPKDVPPMAWYCKGAIARHADETRLAESYFHRFLVCARKEFDQCRRGMDSDSEAAHKEHCLRLEESYVRGWVMMAILLWQRNRLGRSLWLAEILLNRFESRNLHGINGMLYHLLGGIAEKRGDYERALHWFHQAHAAFLGEHSWYYHLYVLYAYARVARKQGHYAQAYWYIDLIEKAVVREEFGVLRRELSLERKRLVEETVDLVIDLREGFVRTREEGVVSFGKQYVLLHILEALAAAHRRKGDDAERGLSKAEIIGIVWKESYRPQAHDNKLYYNINRLRKLVEPDAHRPKYLMNWKEGYRLAPGLSIQVIGGASDPLGEGEQPAAGSIPRTGALVTLRSESGDPGALKGLTTAVHGSRHSSPGEQQA